MKRRFLSAMLSVVMAASLVTGCAGSSSGTADTKAEEVKAGDTKDNGGTGTGNKDTQAASGEQVTLTVMDGYAPEDPHGQYIYQYAEEFMKENPDIKVEIQAIASGDIYTKLAAMATSPDDLPTMFFTSADQVPTLYDLGLTEDLNNWMDKEAIDGLANGVMDACTIDGQMTYYPVAVQPQAVIYRMDRFEGLKCLPHGMSLWTVQRR